MVVPDKDPIDGLNWTDLFNIELFWHLTVCKQNLYLYLTELVELELLD